MDVDLSNFEKEDFSINGFYRALVEDNVDPLGAGRLRVRILGIHPMDVLLAPTENLPWAEPVLSLAFSGGANLQNIDMKPGTPAVPKTKYTPSPVIPPLAPQLPLPVATDAVNQATTEFTTIPVHKDTALCNSGSGGHFSVPAKGSLVWIFFDGGCHLRPHYFAMATQSRDWDAQKQKLTGEMVDRDNTITSTLAKLSVGVDVAPHKMKGTATAGAEVVTNLKPPTYTPLGSLFGTSNRSENLTSWTSPGGTTILANHAYGKEELYIIHKGFSQHIDAKGQVTKIVGTTNPAPTTPVTSINPVNSTGVANDETEFNAGLKNLFIVGDYNLYTVGNCFIQCNQNVQINALANVGVVARTGNINVLAEAGNVNVESAQSLNFKATNLQFEADNDIVFKAKKNIDLNAIVNIQMQSKTLISLDSTSIQGKSKNDISFESVLFNATSTGNSTIKSDAAVIIDTSTLSASAKTNILLNSSLVEIKGSTGVNIDSATVNVKGVQVNVSGDGSVNILGADLSVFGSGTANIGGAIAVVGGATTTITGLTTMGIGAVKPATPATPVTSAPTPASPVVITPYTETPFIPTTPDVPIIPTPSQVV
jgi:hypothetical protein